MPRFICIVKGDKNSESGMMPTEAEMLAMGAFNGSLAKKGMLLAGEGLHPTMKGARIHYQGNGANVKTTITKGPFPEPKPFSGFWIIKADSLEDAVATMRQSPNPSRGEGEVEVRQIFSPEDFGSELTPKVQAQVDQIEADAKKHLKK